MPDRPQKITFAEMRGMGIPLIQIKLIVFGATPQC